MNLRILLLLIHFHGWHLISRKVKLKSSLNKQSSFAHTKKKQCKNTVQLKTKPMFKGFHCFVRKVKYTFRRNLILPKPIQSNSHWKQKNIIFHLHFVFCFILSLLSSHFSSRFYYFLYSWFLYRYVCVMSDKKTGSNSV